MKNQIFTYNNKIKQICLLLLVSLALFIQVGCKSEPPLQHSLWKIEKTGQPTSYLLGTIHINKADNLLNPDVTKALSATKALMTEVIIPTDETELLASPEMMQQMQAMMAFDKPNNLLDQLGKQRYNKVIDLMNSRDNFAEILPAVNMLHSWSALAFLMTTVPNGYSEKTGVDMLLSIRAKQQKIQRIGLESPLTGNQLFAKIPSQMVLDLIDTLIEHKNEFEQDSINLVNMYNQNKIAELSQWVLSKENMLKHIDKKHHAYLQKLFIDDLLIKRNKAWMPSILKQLPQQPTTIAVGLAHLAGKNGLVEQLKAAGYTLTPL